MTPDEAKGLRLGERVLFTHRCKRESQHRALTEQEVGDHKRAAWYTSVRAGQRYWLKWWQPKAIDPMVGVVVGRRTYKNGVNFTGGYDEPIEFVQVQTFTVLLVAYSMTASPAVVLPEHASLFAPI